MNIREQALAFATEAHKGQKRKDGKDYISHPIAVAEIAETKAKEFGITEEQYLDDLYIISILHDVIEDHPEKTNELFDKFGIYALMSIQALSRESGESYFDFIMRLGEHLNPLPLIVKLSDIEHNMSDLQEGSMKDKYRFAAAHLKSLLQ